MYPTSQGIVWCFSEILLAFSKLSLPQRMLAIMRPNDLAILPLALKDSPLVNWFVEKDPCVKKQILFVADDLSHCVSGLTQGQIDYIAVFFHRRGVTDVMLAPYYITPEFDVQAESIKKSLSTKGFTFAPHPIDANSRNKIENKCLFHPTIAGHYQDLSKDLINKLASNASVPVGFRISNQDEYYQAITLLKIKGYENLVLKKADASSGLSIYYLNENNYRELGRKILDAENWVVEENLTLDNEGYFFSVQYFGNQIIEEPFIQEASPKLIGVHSSHCHGNAEKLLRLSEKGMSAFFECFNPEWFGSVDFYLNETTNELTIVDINYGRVTLTHLAKMVREKWAGQDDMISVRFINSPREMILKKLFSLPDDYSYSVVPLVIEEQQSIMCFLENSRSNPFKCRENFCN